MWATHVAFLHSGTEYGLTFATDAGARRWADRRARRVQRVETTSGTVVWDFERDACPNCGRGWTQRGCLAATVHGVLNDWTRPVVPSPGRGGRNRPPQAT